jgi:hypothetical protein
MIILIINMVQQLLLECLFSLLLTRGNSVKGRPTKGASPNLVLQTRADELRFSKSFVAPFALPNLITTFLTKRFLTRHTLDRLSIKGIIVRYKVFAKWNVALFFFLQLILTCVLFVHTAHGLEVWKFGSLEVWKFGSLLVIYYYHSNYLGQF